MASPFHCLELYPELAEVSAQFDAIRTEILPLRSAMTEVTDDRVQPGAWRILPLLAEAEDRAAVPDQFCLANRRLAPRSAQILSAVPELHAYSFSALAPGGHIRLHRHRNPFVTAALCLQDGGASYIVVAGERQDFRTRETIIFDYTMEHEVVNLGPAERVILLMLLNNRMLSRSV
jgi:hypothetical protein